MSEDWRKVYFGNVERSEVQKYIQNPEWQEIRVDIKGKSLSYKYFRLKSWLEKNNYSREAQVQSTNYVTALSRGGLIKPEDYRVADCTNGLSSTIVTLGIDNQACRHLIANNKTEQRYFFRTMSFVRGRLYIGLAPLAGDEKTIFLDQEEFMADFIIL